MFSLARTTIGELLSFEFGEPLDPTMTLEERVQWILQDYEARRYEFVDISGSQASGLLHRWLQEAGSGHQKRILYIRALGFIRTPNSTPHLEPILKAGAPSAELRETILALGRIGRLNSFKKIEPFLQSGDREIRKAAIIALSKSPDRATFSALDRAAGSDAELKELVRVGYRRLGALEAKDLRTFTDVVIETDEYEDLLHLMEVVREYVVDIVGDHKRSTKVRRRAIEVTGAVRLREAAGSLALITADQREPMELRIEAAKAAGRVRAKIAIAPLADVLDDSDLDLVNAAITSLGQIGTEQCISPLLARWMARGGSLRERIRLALRRLATLDGGDFLETQLRSGNTWRPAAIYFISDNLQLDRRYQEGLLDGALRSDHIESRREAILLLAFLGIRGDAAKVESLQTKDPEPAIREMAEIAVARMRKR